MTVTGLLRLLVHHGLADACGMDPVVARGQLCLLNADPDIAQSFCIALQCLVVARGQLYLLDADPDIA